MGKASKWAKNGSRFDGYNRRTRVQIGNYIFDSKGESERYLELFALEQTGEIFDLEIKPALPLVVNGVRITPRAFKPDFKYEMKSGQIVVEDYKGYKMERDFKIKWQLAKALYPRYMFKLSGPCGTDKRS